MGFINKITGFFRKKEESTEKIDMSVNRKTISDYDQKPQVFDRIVGLANQKKPVEDKQESVEESFENEQKERHEVVEEESAVSDYTPKEKIIVPSTKGNVNFVNIDVNKL